MIQSFNGISPTIGKNVYIAETAVVIGNVHIGDDCSIWPSTVIRGDMNSITIGHHTNVQDGAVIHVAPDRPPSSVLMLPSVIWLIFMVHRLKMRF